MSASDFVQMFSGGPTTAPIVAPSNAKPHQPATGVQVSNASEADCSFAYDGEDGLVVDDDGGCIDEEQMPQSLPAIMPSMQITNQAVAGPVAQPSAPATAAVVQPPLASADTTVDFFGALNGSGAAALAVLTENGLVAPVTQPPAGQVAATPAAAAGPESTTDLLPTRQLKSSPPIEFSPGPRFTEAAPGFQEYADHSKFTSMVAAEINSIRNLTGICVLDHPDHCDNANPVHVAIYNMRHNPAGLVQMPAGTLCIYEAALSAQQVYVQSLANDWAAKYQLIGREMDRIMRLRRKKYKGDTEKDKEDQVLANEPQMVELRQSFLKAQAIATYLLNMGDRFKQLEDGLKRLISYRADEESRVGARNKYTA